VDKPRFAYRVAMLDAGRHFFPISMVERYLDELALYKVNYFHLHLSDDQGLRIAIDGLPRLASVGGSTEVGGGPGGIYTKADYLTIVRDAAARYITGELRSTSPAAPTPRWPPTPPELRRRGVAAADRYPTSDSVRRAGSPSTRSSTR
jgi:N-acetyl-beta-hexosaminidase